MGRMTWKNLRSHKRAAAAGVEFNGEAARFAILRWTGGGLVVEAAGEYELDVSAPLTEEARHVLRRVRRAAGPARQRLSLALGITGMESLARTVDLPNLPEDEAEGAAVLEAAQYAPYPIEEACAKALLLPKAAGSERRAALVMSAPRGVCEQLLLAAEAAGIPCEALELTSYALGRILPGGKGDALVVNLGSGRPELSAYTSGRLVFARTLASLGSPSEQVVEVRRIIDYLARERRLSERPALYLAGRPEMVRAVGLALEEVMNASAGPVAAPGGLEVSAEFVASVALALGEVGPRE